MAHPARSWPQYGRDGCTYPLMSSGIEPIGEAANPASRRLRRVAVASRWWLIGCFESRRVEKMLGAAVSSSRAEQHLCLFPACATLKHMTEVGIRALKQNASTVVADAASGETVTITDRGRPVAQMTAIPMSRLGALVEAGRARRARCDIVDLPAPAKGPDVSVALAEMRDAERY